ncbi:MAG TPA: protein kinase [Anaerolineae bacterium]|nr:protein kinase [Anaerolineae bacterium]
MDLVGKELGSYRVTEKIGQGTLARVYRAYQQGLDRWVAVKVFDAADLANPAFLMRFQREARAVAKLRHPHILTVYDYGAHAGLAYLVTDHVDGGTLESRLTGEPLDWSEAAALILPVARALAYAHGQGMTHQNVKPSNVLLARDDWPLLSDFGVARMTSGGKPLTEVIESGAPYYVSPEQAQAVEVDARSDIYSLGIVLYEVVTGRRPFNAQTPLEIVMQHINETPESPCAINSSLPAMAEAIILRAMAKNPGGRYQAMEEMVNALQTALTQTAGGSRDLTYTPMIARHDTCPRCGAIVNTLGRYCAKCGATLRTGGRLPTAPLPPEAGRRSRQAALGPHFVLNTGSTILLPPKTELTIGRSDKFNQIFPDIDLGPHDGATHGVSRVHARLLQRGHAWVAEDAGSTNGTFLNGRRVAMGEEALLRDGDRLRFGQLTLTFRAK